MARVRTVSWIKVFFLSFSSWILFAARGSFGSSSLHGECTVEITSPLEGQEVNAGRVLVTFQATGMCATSFVHALVDEQEESFVYSSVPAKAGRVAVHLAVGTHVITLFVGHVPADRSSVPSLASSASVTSVSVNAGHNTLVGLHLLQPIPNGVYTTGNVFVRLKVRNRLWGGGTRSSVLTPRTVPVCSSHVLHGKYVRLNPARGGHRADHSERRIQLHSNLRSSA